MSSIVVTIKVKPGMEKEFEAVEAHRSADSFKARGGKMGEYMDGRAEMLRLQEVV